MARGVSPKADQRRQAERRSSRFAVLDGLDAAGREKLLAELDAVLSSRVRDIRLTGRLREIYRAASWRHRSRTIRFWLLWVSVFSAVTCLIDYVMHPPLLGVSVALRSVFIPVFYAVLAWIWVRPRASWIEGVTLPLTVAAMMLVAELLGSAGGGALHERYLMAGLFATSTAIVVFPIERLWSIAGTVVVIGLFLMFGLMNPDVEAKVPILETTFFTFVIGCLVPARQAMNTVLEHAYLLSLRKRILTEALAAANARLAVLADTDGLTGLPNRRAFEARLAGDWAEQAARSGTIGAILIDVDHFKRFNDSAGHAAGDRCLVAVAEAIRAAMPDGALAARYGGEEFVAVVPGTRPRALAAIAERIRSGVAALALPHPGLPDDRSVTVSVGIALAPAEGDASAAEALLQRADAALYEAKARGRDSVVAAWAMKAAPAGTDDVRAA
ncbi:diguanylate cyclase [Methylobacterium durans]|uniref:GGDEF domain-containing protein n=1 Tax=Methylobacterium durans TaxID=2202825 RepID=UPI002AFEEFCA|nr:diguanylate cyclase [Methylobacterium durans]MEA1831927.1 diguanylate cyclase [Methylobacterium durans]